MFEIIPVVELVLGNTREIYHRNQNTVRHHPLPCVSRHYSRTSSRTPQTPGRRLGHGGVSALSPFYPNFGHWSVTLVRQLRATRRSRDRLYAGSALMLKANHLRGSVEVCQRPPQGIKAAPKEDRPTPQSELSCSPSPGRARKLPFS